MNKTFEIHLILRRLFEINDINNKLKSNTVKRRWHTNIDSILAMLVDWVASSSNAAIQNAYNDLTTNVKQRTAEKLYTITRKAVAPYISIIESGHNLHDALYAIGIDGADCFGFSAVEDKQIVFTDFKNIPIEFILRGNNMIYICGAELGIPKIYSAVFTVKEETKINIKPF